MKRTRSSRPEADKPSQRGPDSKTTLADLLSRITPENRHPETSCGPDIGKEIVEAEFEATAVSRPNKKRKGRRTDYLTPDNQELNKGPRKRIVKLYDPPEGWRYGFPKIYIPLPGETLEATLLRDGYPQSLIDQGFGGYVRVWQAEVDELPESEHGASRG